MKKIGNKISDILMTDPDSFTIRLKFCDGAELDVSLRDIFDSPQGLASEVLRGGMFDQCFVENGALAWPNGLELCADMLASLAASGKKIAAA